jgi:hypothetical protein
MFYTTFCLLSFNLLYITLGKIPNHLKCWDPFSSIATGLKKHLKFLVPVLSSNGAEPHQSDAVLDPSPGRKSNAAPTHFPWLVQYKINNGYIFDQAPVLAR